MDDLTQVRFRREGAVAVLTLARPHVLNALSPTLIAEALRVAEAVAASDARALVIEGEGKSFSAGVDLKAVTAPDYTPEVRKAFSDNARRLCVLLETMPQPVIARVTGHCFTGGLELALACDFILAADDAVFCDTHAKLGMRSGWGLSQRLPRRIGQQRAREMSFTARRVPASEAVQLGLILDAVPADRLDVRVAALIDAILPSSADAVAAYKTLYRKAQTTTLDDGLKFEATADLKLGDRATRVAASGPAARAS
ncbi:MAG: enoyl-CoA hydratase/carnithine racemase [Caulobacter sp.]|nr:enoyl-CoA hydratase/carnithine racemase [Caulobacter sp.]